MDQIKKSFVGIDVAKLSLDVHLNPHKKIITTENNKKGFKKIIKFLPKPKTCHIVIEATGGYQNDLAAALLDAGHAVSIVNPRQIRNYAQALGILAKTDAIDASVLADYAEKISPRLTEKTAENQRKLTELVTRRRQLVDMRSAEKNRQSMKHGKLIDQSLTQTIRYFEKQIARLETEIASLIEADDELNEKAKLLTEVKGVAEQTANVLLSELPELGKLNRAEVAALAGLAPYNCESGKFRGKRRIRGGRSDVRKALYMASFCAMRCNPQLKKFAERLREQGKGFKVVVTACMRKLLVILNSLIKNKSHWNPNFA